ncbi:MAG: hypothetical protein KIS92_15070 [Planctomycetota bacterium]|nr:hypothetical protein [Planctomycetota bacterium]
MTTDSAPSPDMGSGAAPKKRMSSGCQVALGCLGIIALVVVVVALIIGASISWLSNGREAAMSVYPAPALTTGQQFEMGKIHADHLKAYHGKTDWDVVFTPELFNAFAAEQIRKKKADGTFQKGEAEGVELQFQGNDTVLRFSYAERKEPGFYNFELRGDPHIENGKFLGRVDKVILAGKESPWLARKIIDSFVEAARKGELKNEQSANPQENPLAGVKLLRREGDKIHFIVEAGKVPAPEEK